MSRCGCCCKEYGRYQECLCRYGGYGHGYGNRTGGSFSLLVILILILLFFGNVGGLKGREHASKFVGMDGIIFIITLYYLACGCGFGGLGGAY